MKTLFVVFVVYSLGRDQCYEIFFFFWRHYLLSDELGGLGRRCDSWEG